MQLFVSACTSGKVVVTIIKKHGGCRQVVSKGMLSVALCHAPARQQLNEDDMLLLVALVNNISLLAAPPDVGISSQPRAAMLIRREVLLAMKFYLRLHLWLRQGL